MSSAYPITFGNEELLLLRERAVWWEHESALLLCDLHLGKAMHFRKHGLALSAAAGKGDLVALEKLIRAFPVKQIYFLGDLFHSTHNQEWEQFGELVGRHPSLAFKLVPGNHDILDAGDYRNLGIVLLEACHCIREIQLVHDPDRTATDSGLYTIQGHLHPGISIHGKGRQRLRFPAFCVETKRMILPAFGKLTGLHTPSGKSPRTYYAIGPEQVFEVKKGA